MLAKKLGLLENTNNLKNSFKFNLVFNLKLYQKLVKQNYLQKQKLFKKLYHNDKKSQSLRVI